MTVHNTVFYHCLLANCSDKLAEKGKKAVPYANTHNSHKPRSIASTNTNSVKQKYVNNIINTNVILLQHKNSNFMGKN